MRLTVVAVTVGLTPLARTEMEASPLASPVAVRAKVEAAEETPRLTSPMLWRMAAPAELPVGVITGLVGGPFFLVLLLRERRRVIV